MISLGHIFKDAIPSTTDFQLQLACFGITLVIAIGLSIWGRGVFRLLCIVLAIVVGSIVAYYLERFSPMNLANFHQADLIALPIPALPNLAFSWQLAPVFAIGVTKATGAVILNAIFMLQASIRAHHKGSIDHITHQKLDANLAKLALTDTQRNQMGIRLFDFIMLIKPAISTQVDMELLLTKKSQHLECQLTYHGRYPTLPGMDTFQQHENLVDEKLAMAGLRNFFSSAFNFSKVQCHQKPNGIIDLQWHMALPH